MEKILLVEDDDNLGPSLKKYLKEQGMEVKLTESLKTAREVDSTAYSVVVLDWMLPDGQGIDLLKEMRANGVETPVIMLTARTDLIDRVVGLESGANDYMSKPFEPRELVARIRVQLRHLQGQAASSSMTKEKLAYQNISMDLNERRVRFNDVAVDLTKMEFELLRLFLEQPGRAFSREEILNKVWGYENYPTTRTVDTHVLQLRQKFEEELIETVRGIGYRLKK